MSEDKAYLFAHYWQLLAPAYPAPIAEYHFDKAIGRKHRFDWAWPDIRIAVEIDGGGYAYRGGRHSTDADRDKLNIAASMGWRVFHFSPKQIKNEPMKCIEYVIYLMESGDK